MFPHERSLVTKYRNKPFVLLGVNEDPKRSSAREAEKDGRVTWRSWWDPQVDGRIGRSWKVQGMPTIILIDYQGKVADRFFGVPDEKELEKRIDKLIEEKEAGR